jgi:hypothetical protein
MKLTGKLIPKVLAMAGVWLLASFDTVPGASPEWVPYFMTRGELERSVSYTSDVREMTNPGKIALAGDNIFVVERYRGIHVIDNTTPENPRQTGFIVAPGCMDITLKGSIVYLDNSVDLVAFDMATKAVTSRLKYYFPEPLSPTGQRYWNNSADMILVGWKQPKSEEAGR